MMDYNIIIPNGIFGKSNRKECISRRGHLQDMKDMAFTYVITIARTLTAARSHADLLRSLI